MLSMQLVFLNGSWMIWKMKSNTQKNIWFHLIGSLCGFQGPCKYYDIHVRTSACAIHRDVLYSMTIIFNIDFFHIDLGQVNIHWNFQDIRNPFLIRLVNLSPMVSQDICHHKMGNNCYCVQCQPLVGQPAAWMWSWPRGKSLDSCDANPLLYRLDLYHLEYGWRNSHILVYHSPLQIATFGSCTINFD